MNNFRACADSPHRIIPYFHNSFHKKTARCHRKSSLVDMRPNNVSDLANKAAAQIQKWAFGK
jgi:hypothetical protein